MYEAVDQQITLDVGQRGCRVLYEAARETPTKPLAQRAADCLAGAIEPGEPVLLTTGFPIWSTHSPETDGPLGAALLADAVETLGAIPVVVVDERTQPVVTAVLDELGVESAAVECILPTHSRERLLEEIDPTAAIAIETPGRTADGSYRNMTGTDISSLVEPVDELFVHAADRDIPTIAVGDGGNEIGMGCIRSTVETHIEHGETIAAVTEVDELVVAGVSNWGAYGLVAALSMISGQQLLHTGETEQQLLAACVEAGAVDGVAGTPTQSVDGIPGAVHAGVVDILRYCCGSSADLSLETTR